VRQLNFILYGKPVAQGRPRAARRGKFITLYDPAKSRSWKAQIVEQVRNQLTNQPLLSGPISLTLIFYMPKPKSLPKKKALYHVKRPDLSNLEKAVEDALNDVVYIDDSQVFEKHSYKIYASENLRPGVKIEITEYSFTEEVNNI